MFGIGKLLKKLSYAIISL